MFFVISASFPCSLTGVQRTDIHNHLGDPEIVTNTHGYTVRMLRSRTINPDHFSVTSFGLTLLDQLPSLTETKLVKEGRRESKLLVQEFHQDTCRLPPSNATKEFVFVFVNVARRKVLMFSWRMLLMSFIHFLVPICDLISVSVTLFFSLFKN